MKATQKNQHTIEILLSNVDDTEPHSGNTKHINEKKFVYDFH